MGKRINSLSEKLLDLTSLIVKNEKKIYYFLFFTGIIIFILFAFDLVNLKKIYAFMIFVLVGGVFKYFISRFRIFVELTPIAFFAVIIANYFGVIWVVLYLIAADVIPSFLGKFGPDKGSVPHWTWVFLISIMALPFDATNIFFKILIPLIYFLGCLFVEHFILGGLNGMSLSSSFVNLAINLYFFVTLSEFFIKMII